MLTQRQVAKLPGRILCWKVAVPQVNLWVQKLALFIVWITHYFDCPGWLGLQIGNCCWECEAKCTSHRTKEHTHPGIAHRDICFCFLSNCAATQGRLGTQAHALRYLLVITEEGFHVAGDERIRSISEVGVFPIMQITSKYLPHFIILAGRCLWISWPHIWAFFALYLGEIFCVLKPVFAGNGQPWAQPVGLPLSVVVLEGNQYVARNVSTLPGKIRAC